MWPRREANAEVAVTLADHSGDAPFRVGFHTTHADALHQAGRREEAAMRFAEAEVMQVEGQPAYPLLCSLQGFRYCDLLLGPAERTAWRHMGRAVTASRRPSNPESAQSPWIASLRSR